MGIETILASTVVSSFLIPYVKMGAEGLIQGVSKKLGESTAEGVADVTKNVWNKIKSVFTSPKEKNALELFEENPEETQSLIEKLLREKIEHDPSLAKELSDLVNSPIQGSQNSGAQIMQAHIASILDLRNADFSHAQGTRITGIQLGSEQSEPESEDKK